ncbi:MAG: S9 family peptidase [Solirubrobacteraceae bacterium]
MSQHDVLRALLRAHSTVLADVDLSLSAAERLLVRNDRTGTMQLYELAGDELLALTALPEPVAGAHYIPGRRQAVLEIDQDGNERHQLYALELDRDADGAVESMEELSAITEDARFGNHFAGSSPDGRLLAYVSNRRNGVDFDLWLYDLVTGEHRLRYAPGAWCQPGSGFSPDGRLVSVIVPGQRPLDEDLVLVDVDGGDALTVLAHPSEPALVGAPAWIDATRFCVSSNVGGDYATVAVHDLASGTTAPFSESAAEYDAVVVASRDGATILVIENRDGASAMQLYNGATGHAQDPVPLPEPGVVHSHHIPAPLLSADGGRVYYTLSTPRLAADVFLYDRATGSTRRLTEGAAEVPADELVGAESLKLASFDGEQVPTFVFRPRAGEARPPVVVVVHGGPEAQAVLSFNPVIQGLVLAGYAVVVPNVRGSTGYGKRYASLDDTTKRLDSVRDLAAVYESLEQAGLDRGRAALWGGSYGGYMVLAGLAFQSELWAAGVDIVGISDLTTFLENTSDYRRAHREREYGSLKDDREFLARASPLSRIDDIRAPLFVIHGLNDPRVPVSEAEQLVENLRRRGVPCTLKIYDDEGHGLARLSNRLDAYPAAITFLDEVLRDRGPAAGRPDGVGASRPERDF